MICNKVVFTSNAYLSETNQKKRSNMSNTRSNKVKLNKHEVNLMSKHMSNKHGTINLS